jgi:hypothetical protein
MPGLTLGAEQALLEEAVLGFEMGDAGFEFCFAYLAGLEPGAVKASLLTSLEELGAIRTGRAAKGSKWSREGGGMGGRGFRGRTGQGRTRSQRSRQLGWGRIVSSGATATFRSSGYIRRSNAFIRDPVGPRLLRLRVVCGDHATRRSRCWGEG